MDQTEDLYDDIEAPNAVSAAVTAMSQPLDASKALAKAQAQARKYKALV